MAHFAELKQKTDPTGFTSDQHWVVDRGVLLFLVVALGNKLLIITILEKCMLV